MQTKSLLASTPFLIINKSLLLTLGVDANLVLSDLLQKEEYFVKNNKLIDGYFFNTVNNISCCTTLSYYQIKQSLATLTKWGIIQVIRKGVPAKLHFKIDKDKILNILNTSIEKSEELECQTINIKSDNNLNSINNNKVIKKNNNSIEIRKDLFINEVNKVEDKKCIEDFIDYWTEDNGKKMRFELEKTWNTNLRYKRWCRNQQKFNKSSANNMPDFLDQMYLNRIREDQAQVNKFYKHLVDNCGYERFESLTGYVKYRKKR
jgi:hypothetical protein